MAMMKAVLLCLALVVSGRNYLVHAECIVPPPPCESLTRATFVAVVDAIEAAEPWRKLGDRLEFIPQVVKLRVVEQFKGTSRQQREITGRIFNDAESVFLETGNRYLLYAIQKEDGTWLTSCSRTKLAETATAEVWQLRRCIKK